MEYFCCVLRRHLIKKIQRLWRKCIVQLFFWWAANLFLLSLIGVLEGFLEKALIDFLFTNLFGDFFPLAALEIVLFFSIFEFITLLPSHP